MEQGVSVSGSEGGPIGSSGARSAVLKADPWQLGAFGDWESDKEEALLAFHGQKQRCRVPRGARDSPTRRCPVPVISERPARYAPETPACTSGSLEPRLLL